MLRIKLNRTQKIILVMWVIFTLMISSVPLYFYSVKVDFLGLYGGMPELKALENPENDLSSELFTEDGV